MFLPDRERDLQGEQLSVGQLDRRTMGVGTRLRGCLQCKQRLLQSGAADDDIPKGVADRSHRHDDGLCGSRNWQSVEGKELGKGSEGCSGIFETKLKVFGSCGAGSFSDRCAFLSAPPKLSFLWACLLFPTSSTRGCTGH